MVASNCAPALACVLVREGGKDDDPRGPGGRAAYGVAQARYNQYRRPNSLPQRDVWDITPDERMAAARLHRRCLAVGVVGLADLPSHW